MINLYDPVHPGEFIREMFMEPFQTPAAELADNLDVSQSTLSRLLNGKTDLSYEMALRLSKVVGRSAESWVIMQKQCSLSNSRLSIGRQRQLCIRNSMYRSDSVRWFEEHQPSQYYDGSRCHISWFCYDERIRDGWC
ncbi:HigA family addiction module antidote protein, partial [Enterobacter hormaechei]|uniref:HigA family addiction module antitoxin n=1 Tax=Enterobacter hormaechei TaxID=158836 RepID=UPI001921E682